MMPIRSLSSRTARARVGTIALQRFSPQRTFTSHPLLNQRSFTPQFTPLWSQSSRILSSRFEIRTYATKTAADEIIEEIQEQYATAKDEFEIASEETERKTVYAADDRAAAREELNNLKDMYEEALEGPQGEEVKRRVGQRIRELDNAVQALEKSALEE